MMNINATLKMAADFVTPFNAQQFMDNAQRLRTEAYGQDYINLRRVLFEALKNAFKGLVCAAPLHAENKNLNRQIEEVY